MSDVLPAPSRPALRLWYDMIAARQARRTALVAAFRTFLDDVRPSIPDRPRRRAIVDARLQMRENLIATRMTFRRNVIHALDGTGGQPQTTEQSVTQSEGSQP